MYAHLYIFAKRADSKEKEHTHSRNSYLNKSTFTNKQTENGIPSGHVDPGETQTDQQREDHGRAHPGLAT